MRKTFKIKTENWNVITTGGECSLTHRIKHCFEIKMKWTPHLISTWRGQKRSLNLGFSRKRSSASSVRLVCRSARLAGFQAQSRPPQRIMGRWRGTDLHTSPLTVRHYVALVFLLLLFLSFFFKPSMCARNKFEYACRTNTSVVMTTHSWPLQKQHVT